ncbi:MAG TPA: hypothetical protein VGE34_00635 [Candidatus Saccharimonadales bacterium]
MTLEMQQTPTDFEREPVEKVDSLVLVDLDRTLIKSDELVDVVAEYQIAHSDDDAQDKAILEYAARVHEGAGGAVSPYAYMREAFGLEADPEQLAQDMVRFFGEEELVKRIVISGAKELVDFLDESTEQGICAYGLQTFTEDVVGQEFKIALLRRLLEPKHMKQWIVNHQAKATRLEAQISGDGSQPFHMADGEVRIEAQHAIIIDDKEKNLLHSTPERLRSIHVYADDVAPSTPKDAVSLEQAVEILKMNLAA